MRILLVDDDPRVLEALTDLLAVSFPAASIATESSASKAIDRIRESAFDIVLSDVVMESDAAGWTLARAARERGVRILLMSADERAPGMVLERGVALVRKDELSARSIASFVTGLMLSDPS